MQKGNGDRLMTPEEATLLAADFEQAIISAEDIAETLPLTQGEGSIYRKDEETGAVSHEKVFTGAEHARVNFKMTMPKLQGPDFTMFIEAAKNITLSNMTKTVKTFSDEDIEKVNSGGIIGSLANEIIKKNHSENE